MINAARFNIPKAKRRNPITLLKLEGLTGFSVATFCEYRFSELAEPERFCEKLRCPDKSLFSPAEAGGGKILLFLPIPIQRIIYTKSPKPDETMKNTTNNKRTIILSVFRYCANPLQTPPIMAELVSRYNFEPDKYIISDELSVKKYNVIINFTDYLINKWKKGALFSQMTKNSKAVNYPKTLTKFINNINFIIQDEKDAQTKTMKTVFLYQYMKKEQINKALAFMLYTIYLAKANFDNNKGTSKENEAEKNKERFMNAIDKIYELIDAKSKNTNYEVENTKYKVEKTTVDNHKGIIITLVDKNKKYTIDWVKFTRNPMNNNTYIYRFLDNIAMENLTIEKLLKSFDTFVTDKGKNNYNGMTEESL